MNIDVPNWDVLRSEILSTPTGAFLQNQVELRSSGQGLPHTDAKLRLFGTLDEPRVTFFRDTAGWCPYCQKVWILLEEKQIPYKVQKINMRSYGDKPAEFLRLVPNGLLPAVVIDGKIQTESLPIMLNLDSTFTGSAHKPMFPLADTLQYQRAEKLMRMERELFSSWCSLVFRPASSNQVRMFVKDLDRVDEELRRTASPWFLDDFSIVDLTYITHVERMCASVPYWAGFKIRGSGKWPAIERWMDAFETMPSYMATKSDYYTHIMDIPPQYGPGYRIPGSEAEKLSKQIDGSDGSWNLPLPPFSPTEDVEPIYPSIDPGEEASRYHAAYKIIINHEAVGRFALRGAGKPGVKKFQAPLADPYAIPELSLENDMDVCLRYLVQSLILGYTGMPPLVFDTSADSSIREGLTISLKYLQARIGVPRDMDYPAARQLRAYLGYLIGQLTA